MKKLLSILLSVCVLVVSLSMGASAFAAESLYNEQKQQYNTQNGTLNFYGDKVAYFYFNGEQNELRVAGSYGKDGKTVAKSDSGTNITVKGKYVYWMDYYKGGIMRCTTDGKDLKKIIRFNRDTDSVNYIISGDRIIFQHIVYDMETYDMKSSVLYSASLNGKNRKKLVKGIKTFTFYTYKNKVYYIKGDKLYAYNLKTNKASAVKNKMSGWNLKSMEGNILYCEKNEYLGEKQKIAFKKINVSTKKVTSLGSFTTTKNVGGILPTEKGIFVSASDGMDDDAFFKLKNGKLNKSGYEKFDGKVGVMLNYYKNYIVSDRIVPSDDMGKDIITHVKIIKVK